MYTYGGYVSIAGNVLCVLIAYDLNALKKKKLNLLLHASSCLDDFNITQPDFWSAPHSSQSGH